MYSFALFLGSHATHAAPRVCLFVTPVVCAVFTSPASCAVLESAGSHITWTVRFRSVQFCYPAQLQVNSAGFPAGWLRSMHTPKHNRLLMFPRTSKMSTLMPQTRK